MLEQTPLHVTALDAAGLLLIEWDDARAMHAAMIDALQPFMYLLESHDGCKRLFEAIDKLVPMTNMTALPTRAGVSAAGAVSRHHRRALRRTGPPLPPQ